MLELAGFLHVHALLIPPSVVSLVQQTLPLHEINLQHQSNAMTVRQLYFCTCVEAKLEAHVYTAFVCSCSKAHLILVPIKV